MQVDDRRHTARPANGRGAVADGVITDNRVCLAHSPRCGTGFLPVVIRLKPKGERTAGEFDNNFLGSIVNFLASPGGRCYSEEVAELRVFEMPRVRWRLPDWAERGISRETPLLRNGNKTLCEPSHGAENGPSCLVLFKV